VALSAEPSAPQVATAGADFANGRDFRPGPGCVKKCTSGEMRRIVFFLFFLRTVDARAVLFLFNVIETNFLRASFDIGVSHSLGH